MAFKYKAASLIQDEAVKADGGCLSIQLTAFMGDASFTLNDGDEANIRDGKQIKFDSTKSLDVAVIKCVSGKIDVLIEYDV